MSVVNKHCNDFRLAELSADNFKCLIFMQGLVSTKDAEIRQRIQNKLENELNITLQQIAENGQRYISIKQDSKKNQRIGYCSHQKNTLQKETKSPIKINETKKKQNNLPLNPCSGCGALHWYKDCTFWNKCFICNQIRTQKLTLLI